MHRDDVLALCLGAKRKAGGTSKEAQDRDRRRSDGKDEPDQRKGEHPHAHQHHAHERRGGEQRRHQAGYDGGAELLDARLDVVPLHELGDDLRSLELLLAVGRGDRDLLVEEV